MEQAFGTIDNVDLFIGGLAEKHVSGAEVGPTFETILVRQFAALRSGDRFFWQNQFFDQQTAEMIARTTLGQIIMRNTNTVSLQPDVFLAPVASTHTKMHVLMPVDRHGN